MFRSDYELGKHEHEPDWCQGARPDCSLPYTKKHCNRTCQGKWSYYFIKSRAQKCRKFHPHEIYPFSAFLL